MKTCIFYDLPTITRTDVDRAESIAGAGAVHVRAADAVWPTDCGRESDTVPAARDMQRRAALMEVLDAVHHAVGPALWQGTDLFEVARYEWLFTLLEPFHRASVFADLVCRYDLRRIHWVGASRRDFPSLRALGENAGVQVSLDAPRQRWRTRVSAGVATMWLRLWEAREGLRTRLQARRRSRQRPLEPEERGAIVFAEYFPNSAKLAVRLAGAVDALHRRASLAVAARLPVLSVVESLGRPARLIDEFTRGPGRRDRPASSVRALVDSFCDRLAAVADDCFRRSPTAISLRRLLQPAMQAAARSTFSIAAHWVDAATALVATLQPRAVVSTTYSSYFGRALALVVEAAGVPSVYVQHGHFSADAFWARFVHRHLLVWGEFNRRAFLAAGVPGERIRVVGAPTQDSIAAALRQSAERNGCGASARPARFVYMASRTGGQYLTREVAERTLRAILRAVLDQPDTELLVKLHPGDRTGVVERVVGASARVQVVRTGNSLEIIRDSDVVIVTFSTTGLESCALDKPIIVFNLTGFSDIDYRSYGAAVCVWRAEDLPDAVQRILADEPTRTALRAGRRRLVDDMLAGATGRATQAAADAILEAAGLGSGKPTATLA